MHNNNLNLVRFVAASAVVYGHSWPILGQPDPELFGKGIHGLGVMMFFAVSGYLITNSWAKHRQLGYFWINRALRIVPALTVMVLLVTFVAGPLVSTLPAHEYFSSGETWTYALRNLLLWTTYDLPGVFEGNPIGAVNNSLWTLPMEVAMYAATLAMVPLLARYPRLMAMALTTAAFAAAALYIRQPWALRPFTDVTVYSFRFIDLCVYMPSYLTGVLFAFWQADRLLPKHRIVAVAASSVVLLWAQMVPNAYNLLIILVPVTVLTLVGGLSQRWTITPFTRIGDLSYGTFLWGFVVQQVIVWRVDGAITPLALAAVSLPISWCLGALSWHLVEKPALRLKPSTPSGRPLAGATPPLALPAPAEIAVGVRLARR